MASVGVLGVTTTDVTDGGGATMVTCAVADFVASNVEVAVMFAVPALTPVTCPVCDTVATAAFDVDHATVLAAPFTATTVAVSVLCAPIRIDAGGADSVTLVTAGVGGLTVIATFTDLVASKTDVAVITTEPGETAVTTPVVLTVAMFAFAVVHVTAVDAPPTAVTTAVSACVPFTASVAATGVAVMSVTAGRTFTVTDAVADFVASAVEVAVIDVAPAATACKSPLDEIVAAAGLLLLQVTTVDAPLSTATDDVNCS